MDSDGEVFYIISVTQYPPQNRVSDTFTHVTLNTINEVEVENLLIIEIYNLPLMAKVKTIPHHFTLELEGLSDQGGVNG